MLTSPVNVTIAAASGAGLKANTAASDNNARREPAHVPVPPIPQAETVIEPELPSNSPINHVNAVSATVGNRTILQELSLNIATMLKIPRRPDENLTALFLRIIATIEAMPQAERLAFEMRAGLKPLKITLADLLMALRKPDGQEAARLTAMSEAPSAVPGRTAANAATTTYLEEGTSTGHTEETLAMRAAARNSAAGQSVFSAESKVRAEAPPTDAKVLQNQLKSMFEPGETRGTPTPEIVAIAEAAAAASTEEAGHSADEAVLAASPQESILSAGQAEHAAEEIAWAGAPQLPPEIDEALPLPTGDADVDVNAVHENAADENISREAVGHETISHETAARETVTRENVAISSTSLKLDQPTLDRIRNAAQAIANQGSEATRADPERAGADKTDDRRMQTLLTLKGFAEAVTALPAKAAELLASVVAEAAAPLPEPADSAEVPDPVARAVPLGAFEEVDFAEFAAIAAEPEAEFLASNEIVAEAQTEASVSPDGHVDAQTAAAQVEDHQAAVADKQPLPRHDLAQHAVPFTYAQVQPAREELIRAVSEEDAREETDEEDADDDDEGRERRRPRDEYDAIHDEVPEDEPTIVINRDSSEADRAFALYQRMAGF